MKMIGNIKYVKKKKKIRLKELWLHIDEVSDCQLSVKEAPQFFKIGFVGRG